MMRSCAISRKKHNNWGLLFYQQTPISIEGYNMSLKRLGASLLTVLVLGACSEVQEVIDTGKQVIDTAQGLSNVCTIAEETWTTDVNPEDAQAILKRAVKELEGVLEQNQGLIPDSEMLLKDLKRGVTELEKGLTKKELKQAVSSIQSLCSGLTTE